MTKHFSPPTASPSLVQAPHLTAAAATTEQRVGFCLWSQLQKSPRTHNSQAPKPAHLSSPAPSLWPSLPFGHFTHQAISSPVLKFERDQMLYLISLSLSLRHLSYPHDLALFSLTCFHAHNHSRNAPWHLSITILLQKLNSSSLSFAMLGAYNNTVKNPDPEKIVKQISTMPSQHSVIHAVTIQIL